MHVVQLKKKTLPTEMPVLDKGNLLDSWDHIYLSEGGIIIN